MSDEPPLASIESKGRAPARRKGSPYPKAELVPRLLARTVDFVIAGALTAVPAAGPILALLYLLLADGVLRGQSLGKKIFGIKVVHVPSRRECGYRESAFRNAPFALIWVFFLVPLLGWFLLLTLGLAIVSFETYMVYTDALGIRIGDIFADSQVVDTKVLAADAARPVLLKSVTAERAPNTARDVRPATAMRPVA